MEGKKTFIGYDLGDGETITDLAVLDSQSVKDRVQTLFNAMTMPDNNTAGQPMPTVYGFNDEGGMVFSSSILADPETVQNIRINFKRRPGDLMPELTEDREDEIVSMLKEGWPDAGTCPELHSESMRKFATAVVEYTDAIFADEKYRKSIQDAAVDSDEIVFCVGHPTRWSSFDVHVYSAILRRSVLGGESYAGKPATMVMAAESRAAFLYIKDKATSRVLAPGTSALLIDVGSSTVDITAMTADSRNHQYNSGSNYLGARSIDFIIRQWYLDRLKEDEEDWNVYESLIRMNPAVDQALTLSCRKAKEEVYSVAAKKSRILCGDFMPVRIKQSDIDEAIESTAVADVLSAYADLPDAVRESMADKNWKQLFKEFLAECKAEMTQQGIVVSRIIMTGSASKMPFVPEIVSEVFSEVQDDGILSDMNPSRSISMGLALVGPSNDKSVAFQKDLGEMLENELPKIISDDIPQLADRLGAVLENRIMGMVRERIEQWRNSEIETLKRMTELIEQDCSEERLAHLLSNDEEYNETIRKWAVDVVGQDVAVRLKSICDRYGVDELTIDNLNVMKVSAIQIGDIQINPADDIMNVLSAVISMIAGIVMAVILPTVLGIVISLLSYVSATIAWILFEILIALPGVGWAILIGLVGIATVRLASKGMKNAKEQISAMLQKANLPEWARNMVKDKKIEEQIAKADILEKIRSSILEEKSRGQIVRSVTQGLRKQVERRAEDIKYVIESR